MFLSPTKRMAWIFREPTSFASSGRSQYNTPQLTFAKTIPFYRFSGSHPPGPAFYVCVGLHRLCDLYFGWLYFNPRFISWLQVYLFETCTMAETDILAKDVLCVLCQNGSVHRTAHTHYVRTLL
jgi:hypothetical protein